VLHRIVEEFTDCEERCQVINRLEAEGDIMTRTILHELSTTFITPIDREDIHDINSYQEAILNHIQAVSNRIGVYGLSYVRFPARRMIADIKEMVVMIGSMLARLGSGQEVSETVAHVKELKKECEMLLLGGLGELYDNPSDDPAGVVDIIKWSQIYDRIDKAFNKTWQLAKSIEGIALKNA
jgi:uncharacterized protein Yka (UPF0111/DUF47 family)